ncbi:MAG: 50S ribosomal protein L3 [Candidatus Micrarchaeota archaeon]
MARPSRPRHGSLQIRPRKRATTQTPRINSWPAVEESLLLGFAGFKAGMTHLMMMDDSHSVTKNQEISVPATIVEVPPLLVWGLRAYTEDPETFYPRVLSDVFLNDEKLTKSLRIPTNDAKIEDVEKMIDKISDVRVLALALPSKTGIGRKTPITLEIGVGGKDVKEKLEYCKSLLGKEVKVGDVFKEGEFVDIISVTKGKGWQGPVKRLGVELQRRKSTNKRRHVGTLGPWHPSRIMYTAPQAGQMGYHRRTEISKRILKIGDKPEEINPAGGFINFGLVRGEYVIIKGSVGGPKKRLIRFRKSYRHVPSPKKPEIKYISLTSKQR